LFHHKQHFSEILEVGVLDVHLVLWKFLLRLLLPLLDLVSRQLGYVVAEK
jgi:hypothetical protein